MIPSRMSSKLVQTAIDLSVDARIDKERGVLIIGKREIDLRIIDVIATPRPDVLWRFFELNGVVQAEPIDDPSRVLESNPKKARKPREPVTIQ